LKRKFILYLLLVFLSDSLLACTAFCLKNENQIILAKNLDWPINDGLIFINKRGLLKTAYINDEKRLIWISKYGSITFNQFGKEFPLGGMNETGLVIEELNSWGETPENDNSFKINEFQFVQYILDNYSSVNEIIMIRDSIVLSPLFINLHYLITDQEGNSLIIEFYEGKSHFYYSVDLPYPVLSNNLYKNSLKYITNFQGLGGNLELKDENTSNERFVRAAVKIKESNNSTGKDKTNIAFDILGSVSQDDTQWSIVYDITDKTIHFKTATNRTEKVIKMDYFDFSCNAPVLILNINTNKNNPLEANFTEFTPQANNDLLITVFNKFRLYDLGDQPESVFTGLSEYGNSILCD